MYEESGSPADKVDKAGQGSILAGFYFGSVVRRFEAKKNRDITSSRHAQTSRSLFVAHPEPPQFASRHRGQDGGRESFPDGHVMREEGFAW